MFKTILKFILIFAVLGIAGYFVYNNFKTNKKAYIAPKTFEIEKVYTKFDLDVLEDKIFKELKQPKQLETSANDLSDIGRANPFTPF